MNKLSVIWRLNKLWVYLAMPVVILLPILFFLEFISKSEVLSYSAIIGTIYLFLSLVPPNIKNSFTNKMINKITQKRREIGISSGILFIFHSVFGILFYIDLSAGKLPPVQYIFGAIANYIFIFLLVTSFFGIRAKWKRHWNLWHAMVWMTLPLILMHAGLNSFIKEGDFFSPIVIIYILLILFTFVKSFLPKSFNKDDLKRDYAWAILGLILTGTLVLSSWGQINDIFNVSDNVSDTKSVEDTSVLEVDNKSNSLTFISSSEVAQNNSKDSCFVVYQEKVYDVTDFITNHPGGKDILKACGTNIDNLKHSPMVSSEKFQSELKQRQIGQLK